ncbi:MAG: Aspartate carbamoyltransferase [Alphaproteobacteria bacterium MarineAlpha5_Bin8]|nr:MAG: Aspartate carbamoyltransferase [Alphaproteobacteria bacterium MarineAlpha5_Bin7]PPR46254.1 MAG: Aspartate carbamoyltransferase [Alphaproteobacteria bacterium MarineAlpha5_Bin8]PPR53401.1 MAG: Aspartate carbamoyltransferase [Alphaproteobacteria bacterium MarineAlpha5_Bin6]|tara:strand:- start:23 stop:955 length:933 start_codon:yes stop_codon:yes gene_type:complete
MKNKFCYKNKHLIESKELTKKDIECFLNESEKYIKFNKKKLKKLNTLKGRTIFNLFFEDSTRTRTSFEVAAKRLGADLINVSVKDSSINKGETLLDTMTTINSMSPDVLIVRHPEEGISKKISKIVNACVINAGDGSYEHPTQALLDALTIKKRFGEFKKLKIAICGDILHSRVARSNIEMLSKLGSKINVVGPKSLIPNSIKKVNIFNDMKSGLKNCDIVMMLRIQKERIITKHVPNEKIYFEKYGLDYKKLSYAKKNAFVMHPGPMNREVEIESKLADDITRSLIQEQVTMGVAIRMACLEILINNRD